MPAFYPEGDDPKIGDAPNRSLQKINSLLKSIDTKTGSTTITGPVTVSNEVEVTNSTGNPIPVSGIVGLDATSLAALENISVTFPATQNVNVTNAGLTINDMTSGNAKTKIVDSVGADVTYITTGTAGTPSTNVVSVQGINGGVSLPISGTVTANLTSDAFTNTQGGIASDDGGTEPPYGVQLGYYDNDYKIVNPNNPLPISGTVTDANIGGTSDSAATTDTGTFSVIAFIKRGMQNWTSLLAKIPALVSGRIPVDGSGVTQPISASSLPLPAGASTAAKQPALGTAGTPSSDVITVQGASAGTALNTKETQPIGDYVVNVGAASAISLSGSAVTTASFDAGTTADYVVVTIEGAGINGGLYIDGSPDNTGWTSGQYTWVYYDIPASSSTDAYSYRTVYGQLFGGTRSNYYGRFIVSCTQPNPYVNQNNTFRYFRITTPAAYGSWKYKFVSYKTTTYSLGGANPGGITRVNGRVDIGYVSNLPTVSAIVSQGTATNLKTQAETYQGGTAVGSANPLQVTLANTGANATAVKVDGSSVTQPVSGTVTINNSQGATVTQSTFTSTTASTSLVAASANRKTLTVFNEGAGTLYVSVGATCTTTAYQVRLSAGDYWECPSNQTSLAHTAVFATAGNARVTEVV